MQRRESERLSVQAKPGSPVRADVDPALALAELDRVLASEQLNRSESLARLLRHVVTETLAGRANCIKEYTLGVDVFDRGTNFDPKLDTIVRTQARRLRAKLDEYYAREGANDEVVIELPRGTYVPVLRTRVRPAQPGHRSIVVWHSLAGASIAAMCLWLLARPVIPGVTSAHPERRADSRALPNELDQGASLSGPSPIELGFWGPGTRSTEAYRLYLKGTLGPKRPESLAYLEQALRTDPGFAPAWLAKAQALMVKYFRAEAPPARILPSARESARRALELGHGPAVAHQILGTVAAALDYDWDAAEGEYLRSLEADRHNAWARIAYAHLLVRLGKSDRALEQLRQMGAMDASAPTMVSSVASIYFHLREYDRVLEVCEAVIQSTAENLDCQFWAGRALMAKGLPERAIPFLEKRRPSDGQGFASLIGAYLAAGRRKDALRLRAEAETRATRGYVSPVSLAQTHFAFGEFEAGFRQLERGLEVRDQSLSTLKVEPAYEIIRSDPRFQQMLRKLRL